MRGYALLSGIPAAFGLRTWVYLQRPREYGISGCACGNGDPDWSEFNRHLWCAACQRDFVPESDGIFGGPIPVEICRLMGIGFDRLNLITGEVEKFEDGRLAGRKERG